MKNHKRECRPKILRLTLSSLPFEVMYTGEKDIEFRRPSKWIESRLIGKEYDLVEFINGYGADKPLFVARYLGFDIADTSFCAEYSNGLKVDVEKGDYMICLGKVVKTENIKI